MNRTLVHCPQARPSGSRSNLIRSLLRPLTYINVLSLIAFFIVVGASAFAAISAGDPPAKPPTSTQPIGEPATTDANSPAELTPATEQAGNPIAGDEAPLPASLVPDTPAASESDPEPAPPPQDASPKTSEHLATRGRSQPNESKLRQTSAKRKKADKDERRDDEAGGPPPWARAHGFRCNQAGNAPGSAAFHDCIKSRKKLKRARPPGHRPAR